MKKIFSLLLMIAIFASMTNIAYASESTTTLSTTVPGATYTLNIPANQEVPFGQTETEIGTVTVTNSSGFAEGKNLKVTVSYDEFTSPNVTTKIPFKLALYANSAYGIDTKYLSSGSSIIFDGTDSGSVKEKTTIQVVTGNMGNVSDQNILGIMLMIDSKDWGLALQGEYTATITFKSEVVVEENQ